MRRKLPARVIGLYPDRDKWRLLICEQGQKKSIILPNKEEAERLAKEMGAEFGRPEKRKLCDVMSEWVEHRLRAGDGLPKTVHQQASCLRRFLRNHGEQELDAFTPKRAAALYQQVLENPTRKTGRPLAAASHHFYLGLAKSFFSWAVERGYIGANPFAKFQYFGRN